LPGTPSLVKQTPDAMKSQAVSGIQEIQGYSKKKILHLYISYRASILANPFLLKTNSRILCL